MNKNKIETHYLHWINPETKRRYPAGVAFYEEESGEYRLKIDNQSGKRIYLKTVGLNDGDVVYRLEEATKRKNRYQRVEIGRGISKKMSPENIMIEMAPCFGAVLSLELKGNA